MIRERREEDLEPLGAVLRSMGHPVSEQSDAELKGWLGAYDAAWSWVFDQAPVSVAPTKNVVGHVQVHRVTDEPWAPYVAEHVGCATADLLAISRLFVKPGKHAHGIARYLLTESVKEIRRQHSVPVLDQLQNAFPSEGFCERFGFEPVPSDDPAVAPMIHTA